MAIDHSDMDRYLRDRQRRKVVVRDDDEPWWRSMFAKKPVSEELTPMETHKLETYEEEMEMGQRRVQAAHHEEERLEEQQEQRVSFYQKLRGLFAQEHKLEEEAVELEMAKVAPDTAAVTNDFRTLAQIQVRWLERLPTRVKEEFKESDDYVKLREILSRRGVMKK